MTCFPRRLERERVQNVELAVVASDSEELRRRGPRDTSDPKTRGGRIRFEVAQYSTIGSQHNYAAEWRHAREG